MTGPAEITGLTAAVAAGVITSLHCAGMCGPLACTVCLKPCGRGSHTAAAGYHLARTASYGLVGLGAGLIGRPLADLLDAGGTRTMAWIFVLFFLAIATGLDKRLRLPLPASPAARLLAPAGKHGPLAASATLGFFTPLLPCAPLYLVVAAAALSGSALTGAGIMLAFAAGTIPLLWLLQTQLFRLGQRINPAAMDWTRRGLALVGVVLLLMRSTYTAATGCHLCP